MDKKSGKKFFLSKSAVYLLLLLALVMIYLAVFYPRLAKKINSLKSECTAVQTQIELLSPYEYEEEKLIAEKAALDKKLGEDTRLKQQVVFADLLSKAADEAGFTLKSMTISAENTAQAEDDMQMYSAEVTLANINSSPAGFLKALESNNGCGMYVNSFTYDVSAPEAIAFTATVSMYTKEKAK